jgi:hypothetical protein
LGTNVITFDQALETPPWKSTASAMNELLVAEGYTTSAGRHVRYLAARAGVLIFVGGGGGLPTLRVSLTAAGTAVLAVTRGLGASRGGERPIGGELSTACLAHDRVH